MKKSKNSLGLLKFLNVGSCFETKNGYTYWIVAKNENLVHYQRICRVYKNSPNPFLSTIGHISDLERPYYKRFRIIYTSSGDFEVFDFLPF